MKRSFLRKSRSTAERKRRRKRRWLVVVLILTIGFLIPENAQMPVRGATSSDYHPDTFWYHPWGRSVTHKGVDVFATSGTDVVSATVGVVVMTGENAVGGKWSLVLGPKWRLHYYAHLKEKNAVLFQPVGKETLIGKVGDSGNAVGKAPHLHYSIFTLIPYPWRIDSAPQGWRKMFYLNPIEQFSGS